LKRKRIGLPFGSFFGRLVPGLEFVGEEGLAEGEVEGEAVDGVVECHAWAAAGGFGKVVDR